MDNFLLLKLNRSIWVALLEQKEIIKAIEYFETYQQGLLSLQDDKKLKNKVVEEFMTSQMFFVAVLSDIAQKYMDQNDYPNALICYTSIFKYNQTRIENIQNYIKCLNELKQYDLAIEVVNYLEKIAPENPKIYKLLSEIYAKRDELPKVISAYTKYLELKGEKEIKSFEYNQLGCYYNMLYSNQSFKYDDIIKSLENFEKACELEPYRKLFHKNATIMASKANNWKCAKKHWERLLEINQMSNDDKYDYAAFCLKTQDFDGWHKYFDSRFEKENNKTAYPNISKPKWNGEKNLSKYTLLVHYEQGFGDSILMWNFIQQLAQKAKHVIYVVQDSLADLFKNNSHGIEVIPQSMANLETLKFDYHIPAMSIPIVLKMTREELTTNDNYVVPNQQLVQEYKEKYFNNDKLKIGISFSGNATGNKTRDLSIQEFLPLDKLKNIEIYSFSKGIADKEFEIFKNHTVHNIVNDFINFDQTAAAMENCDIIITSDNCILNLAGALSKKTYALFNWHHEFRWFDLTGNNVVWFNSVKPFVNEDINNWSSSIKKVLTEINELQKEPATIK